MYYSFRVKSPDVMAVPGQATLLDRGINVFSAEVQDLDAFVQDLNAAGVEVLETHPLGELEPTTFGDLLLPGEDAAHVAGVLSGGGRTKT
jgi:hypothetical protein